MRIFPVTRKTPTGIAEIQTQIIRQLCVKTLSNTGTHAS